MASKRAPKASLPCRLSKIRCLVMDVDGVLTDGRLGYVPAWRAWLRLYPEADVARAFGQAE